MVTTMDLSRWQLILEVNINGANILMFDTTIYNYIRQQIEEKFIAALKIGTEFQLADFTTKAMACGSAPVLPQCMFLVLIAMGINSGDE